MDTRMRRFHVLRLILAATVLATIGNGVRGSAALRADDADAGPSALFTAVQLPDFVRYSLVLVRPGDMSLNNVQVQVTLPADADLVDTLQTAGHSVFLGNDAGALRWAAPE